MKELTIITVLVLFCLSPTYSLANSDVIFHKKSEKPAATIKSGYYVVVGAYAASKEYYAKKYADKINSMGYESSYAFSAKRNLFFVYLRYTQNYRESLAKMREARKTEEFKEAWVFVSIEEAQPIDEEKVEETTKVLKQDVVGGLDKMYAEKFKEDKEEKVEEDVTEEMSKEEKPADTDMSKEETEEDVKEVAAVEISKKEANVDLEDIMVPSIEPEKVETLNDVTLFFNLFNARNHRGVAGEVQIIDAERAKLLKVASGGDYIELSDPKNGTGKLLLICDVFGYRKFQREINYYDPLPDTAEFDINLIADIYAVDFDLIRYHKGDIATLYNVYFFKDAAVMRPESKFEVNNLLNMMKENPDYRIKIHGHVNGKHPGKIIAKGESDKFFALDDGNKESFGSAVLLSEKRAMIIKDYLVMQGINENRMEIKAWGGKRMIHDKHSSRAKHNVRVEIEILEE